MTGSPAWARKLHQLLSGHRPPGVYRLVTSADPHELAATARSAGWTVWLLAGAPATKSDLLDAVAASLALPSWFGRNWDALADALTDVVTDAPGGLLVWSGADALAEDSPDEWSTAVAVLEGASAYHHRHGWPFAVVCPGRRPPRSLPGL